LHLLANFVLEALLQLLQQGGKFKNEWVLSLAGPSRYAETGLTFSHYHYCMALLSDSLLQERKAAVLSFELDRHLGYQAEVHVT
jgi:hypothetical protein